jgi:hypothetical protein
LKSVTALLLLFLSPQLIAQDLEGLWISHSQMRIGTELILTKTEQKLFPYFDPSAMPDSILSRNSLVLDVDSSGYSLYRDIRSTPKPISIVPWGDHKAYQHTDSFHLRVLSDTSLHLVAYWRDSIHTQNYFEKITPLDEGKALVDIIDMDPKGEPSLILSMVDTSEYYIDIIDQRHAVITGQREGRAYTASGIWHKKTIQNVLFFAFYDVFDGDFQLFHFNHFDGQVLLGMAPDPSDTTGFPTRLKRVEMKRAEALSLSELSNLRDGLCGKWTATNDPLFYDPAIEFGFLSYQSFELRLGESGTFALDMSGTILKNGESIPLEETSSGTWELASTGKYVTLYPDDAEPLHLTLIDIGKKELRVNGYLKTISEFEDYNVFENREIQLMRMD